MPTQPPAPAVTPHATVTLSPDIQAALQHYAAAGSQTPLAAHAPWLTHGFAGLFLLSAIALVVLLAIQTTKQEGLSGTVGGRVESYRLRPGLEQYLARLTTGAAVLFVVSATLVSLSGI